MRTFNDYKDELLHTLNELRENNILCDTTIRAQGQDFPAHRCVLSAASSYFRAMFSSHLRERESGLVELQEIKSATFGDVIWFIYTGEVSTTFASAQDLVMAADYLIMPSLKEKAAVFLKSKLDASNCMALESFASRYNCETLKQAAVTYKVNNFVRVTRSEDFRKLDVNKVKDLICMDEINVAEEEEVYEATMAWVKHDLPSRECLLPELLECVRWFSMSKYSMRKILHEELIRKNLTCTRLVVDALDLVVFPACSQDSSQRSRLSLDGYENVVILTGTEVDFPEETSDCFVPASNTWVSLPNIPIPHVHHGAAVCGGVLYVMGGSESAPICCFNPKKNEWNTLDLMSRRKGCTVTSLNEELYVIGGEYSWRDVQIYNPVLNKWRQGGSMETSRAEHSAVVLQGHIFVFAGHNGVDCLNSAERYNPLTDQWTEISSMSNVRRSAAAVEVGTKVFVFGGYADNVLGAIEPSCEIFDSSTNQWSLEPSLRLPRAGSGIVSIGDTVYVFGGEGVVYDDEEEYLKEDLGDVQCFDIGTNRWHRVSFIPSGECSFLQASLLKVPKKFINALSVEGSHD
ncbi:kelch-like protein 12 [Stylophora pistillata]|uniref:kelch-like protein 12 n=1 Tax=Stylophora pistillata TaxID=50429 RepID=UPI000C04029B|nr:kelch-like protein 12 [Stylophora pistillata]